ncbi:MULTISPECIES: MalY/PatB family protein [Shouchella]|uniref:cysteine-S-conjugate beta-lyase n=2 Tax=Shouchella TaxID=2893057 RepID=A0ABY7W5R0_9BACI|nr:MULTISPECIES: MalY/PatB family protein [Shouchella]MED4130405.1 pyridoxal phosphate-dependent aminotransferase [Shouchella miscanthi]WDF04292.1 pyridoxal phosphate-dependent aminotransferase [Shouchella hunanensis]GAF21191.1 LOW QUALITY PROTEIN: cystathionine beta-lyase [Bacillus sp. JCM 19047]
MSHFNETINRVGTDSMKWDGAKDRFGQEGLLPLWVADMDFKAPQPVIDALKEKVEHGVYGYTAASPAVNQSIVNWLSNRYNWTIQESDIVHVTGVVPAISNLIQTFSEEEDDIIIQTPVYYPFYDVIEKNNRNVVKNPLLLKDGLYKMDFDGLESMITEKTKMLILCHPHNPGGRVWSKEELSKLASICLKHNVYVISDEIHADLLFDGYSHTPFASVNEAFENHVFTALAPTKTFNLAGVQGAYVVIKDPALRLKYRQVLANTFIGANMFSQVATKAAYDHGLPWLEELMSYIQENYSLVEDYIGTHMPKIQLMKPQGTYLLWMNFEMLGLTAEERKKWLLEEAKVALNHGPIFGEEGKHYERMNLATSRETLMKALDQLHKAYNQKQF